MRAYEDGGCVQCVGEHIAPINGTCEVEEHCVDWHEDRCKRCEPGMYLSDNKCLPCDENCVTCEGEADFCMSCDAARVMYLSQNVFEQLGPCGDLQSVHHRGRMRKLRDMILQAGADMC